MIYLPNAGEKSIQNNICVEKQWQPCSEQVFPLKTAFSHRAFLFAKQLFAGFSSPLAFHYRLCIMPSVVVVPLSFSASTVFQTRIQVNTTSTAPHPSRTRNRPAHSKFVSTSTHSPSAAENSQAHSSPVAVDAKGSSTSFTLCRAGCVELPSSLW